MQNDKNLSLTRIGIFFDGNYFLHVSNYYNYFHPRRSRLSVAGLSQFIRKQVAMEEGKPESLIQIVDAHFFRGRLYASEASQKGKQLFYDRVFDDILMSEGVTTHYLPVKTVSGIKQEKGIDVWLALEAFELAFYKHFDVLVLIAADGDYVPLVRKLNTLGTRVMILGWQFEYTNNEGQELSTGTSQDLFDEATYPMAMHELVENGLKQNDPLFNNLFVQSVGRREAVKPAKGADQKLKKSTIQNLKKGYGFIKHSPQNLFFYYQSLVGADFNDLREGDKVAFTIEKNDKGEPIAINVRLLES